jgi:hypothetical protein
MSDDISHHEHSALVGRQLPKSHPDLQHRVEPSTRHCGRAPTATTRLLSSTAPSTPIDGCIDRDSMEPRERCRLVSKRIGRPECLEKGLLHDVVSFITDVHRCDRPQLPLVLFVQKR